jgi:hypothetical protein
LVLGDHLEKILLQGMEEESKISAMLEGQSRRMA